MAEATDAFNQQWGNLKGYANPPWCPIGRVLSQVKNQQAWWLQFGRANHSTQFCWGCGTIILSSFLGHRAYCSQSPACPR